jgi:hypothetical protein
MSSRAALFVGVASAGAEPWRQGVRAHHAAPKEE